MGEISITISLVYVYVPFISVALYYFVKYLTIKLARLYLKNKYKSTVLPALFKSMHDSIIYIDNDNTDNPDCVDDIYSFIINRINSKMSSLLPNRIKFGAVFTYTNYVGNIENVKLVIKLPFPFWRTVVIFNVDDIYVTKEIILKEVRSNSIKKILNEV